MAIGDPNVWRIKQCKEKVHNRSIGGVAVLYRRLFCSWLARYQAFVSGIAVIAPRLHYEVKECDEYCGARKVVVNEARMTGFWKQQIKVE